MIWTGTTNWHCPALCGCILRITGKWPDVPQDGRSYRHPVPRTITGVTIVATCAEHDGLRTAPLPADPHFGGPGYLTLPADLNTLTEAERLYVALYRYGGQVARLDTCQCRIYAATDRAGAEQIRRAHSRHTRKCSEHPADDDDHTDARENNSRKNRLIARAVEALGLTADSVVWRYQRDNGVRVLYVTLVGASQPQKNQAQAWADTNLGVGHVVVS